MSGNFLYGANVAANGIRQHYLRYGGRGPVVVVVPGITSPAITWGFVGEALSADYDVYILDVRGRGLSSSGPDLDYSLDSCAADLAAFVEALGLYGVTGLGHSMGARHLLRAARSGGFDRLILVDPPVSGPGRRRYPMALEWYTASIALAVRGASADELRQFTPTWSEEHVRLRAEWLHTCYEPAVRASFDGFHDDDIHQDVAVLGVPSLLMAAENGGVIADGDLTEIRSLCPSMEWCRIANAGHMIPWDNLPDFLAQVKRFTG
ncbi:alpha/beta fold hydrolase [Sphingosinicella xenopeptidilytica]|uniref:Alpha/beta fold hydrolase n=1 Tax=Sphingosinicella xenopeptidilytica TaxID=364098 RepID=A0ABW3C5P0_SPHXN